MKLEIPPIENLKTNYPGPIKKKHTVSKEIDLFSLGILNSLTAHIAVIDHSGTIIAVNDAWKSFAAQNNGTSNLVNVGSNYFEACQKAWLQNNIPEAEHTIDGIQQVLGEKIDEFELEYECHSPEEKRWFLMRVTPMRFMGQKAVVSHINITSEKIIQQKLIQKEEELASLNMISKKVRSSLSLEDVTTAVLDQISKIIDPDTAMLFLRKGNQLHLLGIHHKKKTPIDINHTHQVGECLCGISVSTNDSIFSLDIHKDSRCTWTECKKAGLTSFAAIPLKSKNKTIGTIGIASDTKRDFKNKKPFLESIANDVAVYLDNALLYEEILQNSKNLETELSKRKQIQDALQKSKIKYKSLIENIPGMVYGAFADGSIELANGLEQICGYTLEELNHKEKNWLEIIHPDDVASVMNEAFIQGSTPGNWVQSYRIITKTGDIRWVADHKNALFSENGKFTGTDGIVFDITEQKNAEIEKSNIEKRLQHVQKMEAIGTLAGGIAHDFNNILAAILGYTELAIYDLPEKGRKREQLNQVLKAAGRAKELIGQILAFSRNDAKKLLPIKIKPVIRDSISLLKASIPKTIEIRLDLDRNCKNILADPTQIHQVIMNLCTNAYHAMKKTSGILSVSLHQTQLENEKPVSSGYLNPGPYQKLEVGDTGTGIPASILNKIFEPYFTTKDTDEGTGLGLSVVHGIVKSLNGGIDVHSNPGKGTTFTIYFPEIEEKQVTANEKPSDAALTGNEHILFIDDEESLLDMSNWTLGELGYRVTTKKNGRDALDTFQKQPNEFDLIITDMTMPRMTGAELAQQILNIRPEMPIILCTGYSELITADQALAMGIRGYLEKPVLKKTLAQMIRNVLDTEAPHPNDDMES